MVWICKTLVATALLFNSVSTLCVYPHQLAYFNEAAGGPENGHKHLLGSNLDFGQDLFLVREWSAAKRDSRPVIVVSTSFYSPEDLGLDNGRISYHQIGEISAFHLPEQYRLVISRSLISQFAADSNFCFFEYRSSGLRRSVFEVYDVLKTGVDDTDSM